MTSTVNMATDYNYNQPLSQIIDDALGASAHVFNGAKFLPGKYIDMGPDMWTCARGNTVCMIWIYIDKVHTYSDNSITGGTAANPIGILKAFPSGTEYTPVSSVSYEELVGNEELFGQGSFSAL